MWSDRSVPQVLRDGLRTILGTWHEQFDEDLLYWTLKAKLAQLGGRVEPTLRRVPRELQSEVMHRHAAINQYFDNIRYALLDPLTQVWGTLVNALRVAAEVPTVTAAQRETFRFPVESILVFFRAARANMAACDQLHQAFRPMPAPDCQMLAALFNVHINVAVTEANLLGLVRLLSAEGPMTAEDSEAFAALSQTGLIHAAFQGMRQRG